MAYNNLGGMLKMQGRAAEAIACYEHVALLQVCQRVVLLACSGRRDLKPSLSSSLAMRVSSVPEWLTETASHFAHGRAGHSPVYASMIKRLCRGSRMSTGSCSGSLSAIKRLLVS